MLLLFRRSLEQRDGAWCMVVANDSVGAGVRPSDVLGNERLEKEIPQQERGDGSEYDQSCSQEPLLKHTTSSFTGGTTIVGVGDLDLSHYTPVFRRLQSMAA